MYAYRVVEIRPDLSRTLHVGQHDGGEKGSGERLSRLLQALQCENVVVVVSRRYGGVKLGSDRWRLLSMVAKDALRRAAAAAIVKEKAPKTPTSRGSSKGK
jgi:putative IMPACT (imprinted ancient) family translation regulator